MIKQEITVEMIKYLEINTMKLPPVESRQAEIILKDAFSFKFSYQKDKKTENV